ncbi:MAG TPA: trypsin-like peptidase domain-containing protein [Candidatus Hypogeohydataceae bacterium YC41]
MKAVLVHIKGSRRGKTEVLNKNKIRIGTDTSCDLRYDSIVDTTIAPSHAEIEWRECEYILRDLGKGTFVNNEQVEEVALKDGDLIEFGLGGPKLRFRIKYEEGELCKPFRQMLEDSIAVAREQPGGKLDTAGTFFKQLVWEAITQSSFRFRMSAVLVLFLLMGFVLSSFYRSFVFQREVKERVKFLETRGTFAERIIKDYTKGVCLILGSYTLGEEEQIPRPVTYDYTGTGFLVSKDGRVITNRHVAEPWWRKGRFGPKEMGFAPKFLEFRAFFPCVAKSFPLRVERVSETEDLALVRFDPAGEELPVMELDKAGIVETGEPVVVIGYPAGISGILARIDKEVVDELVYKRGLGFVDLAMELSNRGLIEPLATQGHVTGTMEDKIVFDAQTTIGGSGGPIFNHKRKVIGITYGIFTGFAGSNFALPAKGALPLLEPQPEEEKTPASSEQAPSPGGQTSELPEE